MKIESVPLYFKVPRTTAKTYILFIFIILLECNYSKTVILNCFSVSSTKMLNLKTDQYLDFCMAVRGLSQKSRYTNILF